MVIVGLRFLGAFWAMLIDRGVGMGLGREVHTWGEVFVKSVSPEGATSAKP